MSFDALFQEIVGKIHAERRVSQVFPSDNDSVRQPARGILLQIRDLRPECRSVTDGSHDLGTRVADDNADLRDPGTHHLLQRIEEDRLVRNRYELLGAGCGERSQARPLASSQDQPLQHPLGQLFAWRDFRIHVLVENHLCHMSMSSPSADPNVQHPPVADTQSLAEVSIACLSVVPACAAGPYNRST